MSVDEARYYGRVFADLIGEATRSRNCAEADRLRGVALRWGIITGPPGAILADAIERGEE